VVVSLPAISCSLPAAEATAALARRVAAVVRIGDVIHLDGPMGAGKTTFTRALVVALGGEADAVSSPTYTLLHRYDAHPTVVHVDAYRLTGSDELDGIGFAEACEDAVAVIEWSLRVGPMAAADAAWWVALDHSGDGGRRAAGIAPRGRAW
jgi:tRNA threonylcarbamoyl adenosine modification protein YjeE